MYAVEGHISKKNYMPRGIRYFPFLALTNNSILLFALQVNTVQGSSGYSLPLAVKTLSDSSDKDDEKSLMKMLQLEIEKVILTILTLEDLTEDGWGYGLLL